MRIVLTIGCLEPCLVPNGPFLETEIASLAGCDKGSGSMPHPVDERYCPSQQCVRPSAESSPRDPERVITGPANPESPEAAQRSKDNLAISTRIGALTSFVSQSYQLSYRELFHFLADRTLPSGSPDYRLLSTAADSSNPASNINSTGSPDEARSTHPRASHTSNGLDTTRGSSSKLSLRLREMWQQVCKRGVDRSSPESSMTASPVNPLRALLPNSRMSSRRGQTLTKSRPSSSQPSDSGRPQLPQSKRAPAVAPRSHPPIAHLFDIFALMPTPSTVAEQQNVAGVPSNPKQMRGSCMAVIVGLVVGIMWF